MLAPLQAQLGLSDTALGFLSSLFLWSYALTSPFAGILADRYSRTLLVVLSLFTWSIFMGLTGFANGLIMLCLCRFGLGLGESPFHPAAFALIADHQPPADAAGPGDERAFDRIPDWNRRGRSLRRICRRAFCWRASFWVLGGSGIGVAFTARYFVADANKPTVAVQPRSNAREAIVYLSRCPSYLLILGKQILAEASTWIFIAWLPLYLFETFHLKLGAAGFAGSSMLAVSFAVGIAVGGWLSDAVARRGGQYRMLVYGGFYVLAAPFLLLFLAGLGFALVSATVAVCFFVRGVGDASERPSTCEVVPRDYLATAYGLLNTAATASGGLGVFLAGVLKRNWGLNAVFAGSSVLYLITGASLVLGCFLWAPRDMARARALEGARDPRRS